MSPNIFDYYSCCFYIYLYFLIAPVNSQYDFAESMEPMLECANDGIKLHIDPRGHFSGHVYVKGYFVGHACHQNYCQNGINSPFVMDIPYRGPCNVRRHRAVSPPTITYEVTIVMQHHPLFITSGDRAYHLQCVYKQANTSLTQQININEIPSEPVQGVSSPTCRYDVLAESVHGPTLRFANVGDPVIHKWSCDANGHGFLVHSCVVRDEAKTEYKLVDEKGCVTDSALVPDITYSDDLSVAFTTIRAFRFAEQIVVHFSCQITLCRMEENGCEGISPPTCHTTELPPVRTTYRAGTAGLTSSTIASDSGYQTAKPTEAQAHTFFPTLPNRQNNTTTPSPHVNDVEMQPNDADYYPHGGKDIDWLAISGGSSNSGFEKSTTADSYPTGPPNTLPARTTTTQRPNSSGGGSNWVTLPPRKSSKFDVTPKIDPHGGYKFPNPTPTQPIYKPITQPINVYTVSGGTHSNAQSYGQPPAYTPYGSSSSSLNSKGGGIYGLEIIRGKPEDDRDLTTTVATTKLPESVATFSEHSALRYHEANLTPRVGYETKTLSQVKSGEFPKDGEVGTTEPLPYPPQAGVYHAHNYRARRNHHSTNDTDKNNTNYQNHRSLNNEKKKKLTIEVESKEFLVFTSDNPILRASLPMNSPQKTNNSANCQNYVTIQAFLIVICALMQIVSIRIIIYQRRYYTRTLSTISKGSSL